MAVVIKKIESSLPVTALGELLELSLAEGFKMVQVLIDDWNSSTNKFNKPGEAFFIAEADGKVVGMGGRNIDPYLNDQSVARVRRLYVLPAFRRKSVGRMLMKSIMDVPPDTFACFTLWTGTPDGGRFYESLGFSPINDEKTTHRIFLPNQGVEEMPDNVYLVNHPLIQHKLAVMREKHTDTQEFRTLLREISMLMGYELLRDLPTQEAVIETPLEKMKVQKLTDKKLCIVPILRAGLGFVDGLLALVPSARVGHIGLYRDHETLEAVEYYKKFPTNLPDSFAIVVDPMLATGHSAVAAVEYAKAAGATDIRFLCLIAAPVGLKTFHAAHPDVPVYTAAIDRELNESGYILPGIGDAGDRIFGTQ